MEFPSLLLQLLLLALLPLPSLASTTAAAAVPLPFAGTFLHTLAGFALLPGTTTLIVIIIRISPWTVKVVEFNTGLVQLIRCNIAGDLLAEHLGEDKCQFFPAALVSAGYSRHLAGGHFQVHWGLDRACDMAPGIHQFLKLIGDAKVKDAGVEVIGFVLDASRVSSDPDFIARYSADVKKVNPNARLVSAADYGMDMAARQRRVLECSTALSDYHRNVASSRNVTHDLPEALPEEAERQELVDAQAKVWGEEMPEELKDGIQNGAELVSSFFVADEVMERVRGEFTSLAQRHADPNNAEDCVELAFFCVNSVGLTLTADQRNVTSISYSRTSKTKHSIGNHFIEWDANGSSYFLPERQVLYNVAAAGELDLFDLRMAFFHDDGRSRNDPFNPQMTKAIIFCILRNSNDPNSDLKTFFVSILTRLNAKSNVITFVRAIFHRLDITLKTSQTLEYDLEDLEESECDRSLYRSILLSELAEDRDDDAQALKPDVRALHYDMARASRLPVGSMTKYKEWEAEHEELVQLIKDGVHDCIPARLSGKRGHDDSACEEMDDRKVAKTSGEGS